MQVILNHFKVVIFQVAVVLQINYFNAVAIVLFRADSAVSELLKVKVSTLVAPRDLRVVLPTINPSVVHSVCSTFFLMQ